MIQQGNGDHCLSTRSAMLYHGSFRRQRSPTIYRRVFSRAVTIWRLHPAMERCGLDVPRQKKSFRISTVSSDCLNGADFVSACVQRSIPKARFDILSHWIDPGAHPLASFEVTVPFVNWRAPFGSECIPPGLATGAWHADK